MRGLFDFMNKEIPIYLQKSNSDCGLACLKMISYYFDIVDSQAILDKIAVKEEGITLYELDQIAKSLGFSTIRAKLSFNKLFTKAPLPCILFWNPFHYVVLPPQNLKKINFTKKKNILIIDPFSGYRTYSIASFKKVWTTFKSKKGIALLLAK